MNCMSVLLEQKADPNAQDKEVGILLYCNWTHPFLLLKVSPGPSCSKLTISLVNDLLNFKHEYYKYTVIFC